MSTEVISLACCHYMCQHSHNRDPQVCSTWNVDEVLWQRIYELLLDEKICILRKIGNLESQKSGFPKNVEISNALKTIFRA